MKTTVNHNVYGEIVLTESIWSTKKKQVSINGVPLQKTGRDSFVWQNGEETINVSLLGSYMTGCKMTINGEEIQMTAPVKWYEGVLSLLILVFVLVWGSFPSLCMIFPIVGGGIGGAIAGVFTFLSLFFMKATNKLWLKLLIWFGCFAGAVLICWAVAMLIIGAAAKL